MTLRCAPTPSSALLERCNTNRSGRASRVSCRFVSVCVFFLLIKLRRWSLLAVGASVACACMHGTLPSGPQAVSMMAAWNYSLPMYNGIRGILL